MMPTPPHPDPHTLQANVCRWASSSSQLVIAIWHDFCGDFFLLYHPLRFQNSPLTLPAELFPIVWKFLLLQVSLPRMDLCPEIFSLPFHLYRYHFKEVSLPSWVSSVLCKIQKLFCGSCSTCRWSFDVFVGEKVIPLFYSSHLLLLSF